MSHFLYLGAVNKSTGDYVYPKIANKKDQNKKWETLSFLIQNTGQKRELPPDARRDWLTDPQMLPTHAFLALPIPVSHAHGNLELTVFQSVVVFMSLVYHRNYERPGMVAKIEGTIAKLLFLYGVAQLTQCPSASLLAVECGMSAVCFGTFVATNLVKRLYDPWHAYGLHVVPGIWSAVVAANHPPLWM